MILGTPANLVQLGERGKLRWRQAGLHARHEDRGMALHCHMQQKSHL
jgi:hypothetical protein